MIPNEVDYIATGFDVDPSDFGESIAKQKEKMSVGWALPNRSLCATVLPHFTAEARLTSLVIRFLAK